MASRLRQVTVTVSANVQRRRCPRGGGCGDGGHGDGRHAASLPSVRAPSLLGVLGPLPGRGTAAAACPRPCGSASDSGLRLRLVAGEAQEDVVEAGLAQGQAGDGDPGRIERAQHLGADLGPVLDGQLDDVVVDDAAPCRRAGHQRGRTLAVSLSLSVTDTTDVPRLAFSCGRRALGDDPAVVDHDDVAGQAVGLFEVLGGEQHGGAAGRPGSR